MSFASTFPVSADSATLHSPSANEQRNPLEDESPLTKDEADAAMQKIYEGGDRIVGRFLLVHALIAFGLAFFYDTWLVTITVAAGALAMFFVSARLLPRSPITRCLAGLSLQCYVALHIYQLHGMAEMHFFFFTGFTVMIVYQSWKCFWPGAVAIIAHHTIFSLLHNSGVNMYFSDQSFVSYSKLAFHFGIVVAQVGICGYWAHLLRRQTLATAWQQRHLEKTNLRLRTEMAERQLAEEARRKAEEHYRLVSNNIPGLVYKFVRHPDGTYAFKFISHGCREIFGLSAEAIVASADAIFSRLHPEDLPQLIAATEESARYLSSLRWEGRVVLGEEWTKWIQCSSRPTQMADGTIIWDGVVMDISDLHRASIEAREAKEEAERANLAKSEFLSRMSHELRTPLNSILGFGQLLTRGELSEKQASNVSFILTSGRHLLNLVNEVLDISRIETGNLTLSIEAVSVQPLIGEVLTLMRPLADQRSIVLHPPAVETSDKFVKADLQRLKQVMLNLLSNAIKYNRDGGQVTILCSPFEKAIDGEAGNTCTWLRLAVKDTGFGMRAEDLQRLFTPFDRLGAENRAIEGTGIGLALSKRLIEAMGGAISVQSTEEEGSTFSIDLPITEPPARFSRKKKPSEEPSKIKAQKMRKVLHIEDNLANREVMEGIFDERSDIELISAIQGRMGLELAREHLPDVILLDAHLPDLPGAEVLVRLQAEPTTRHIPVILVSADATARQIERLRSLGATEYLTKPFEIDALIEVLDRTLKSVETAPQNP